MSDAPSPSTYMLKAKRALKTARLLLMHNDGDGACNRAYYAMFDAAHAALFAIGIEDINAPIKTHNGLVASSDSILYVPTILIRNMALRSTRCRISASWPITKAVSLVPRMPRPRSFLLDFRSILW